MKSLSKITNIFIQSSTTSGATKDAPLEVSTRKPTYTISLRVTDDEKAQLERDAAGMSRSAYIREKLFGKSAKTRRTRGKFPVKDYEALGRVLGLLGRSGLYSDMHRLLLAIEEGRVAMDKEIIAEIRQTHADIAAMRRDLVKALGLKPDQAQ